MCYKATLISYLDVAIEVTIIIYQNKRKSHGLLRETFPAQVVIPEWLLSNNYRQMGASYKYNVHVYIKNS